ncbi:MAG TPA: hypothetical protein VLJ59_20665 [Mycobacteriales bacterium]|nr:hypothetical protein [Mycobacteriales bacterium]
MVDHQPEGADWSSPAAIVAPNSWLSERLTRYADALWYLESAATPDEVLQNVATVLSLANALVRGEEWDDAIAAEYHAWAALGAQAGEPEQFTAARDQLVQDCWQLDGLARSWLDQPVDEATLAARCAPGLAELAHGSAAARAHLSH